MRCGQEFHFAAHQSAEALERWRLDRFRLVGQSPCGVRLLESLSSTESGSRFPLVPSIARTVSDEIYEPSFGRADDLPHHQHENIGHRRRACPPAHAAPLLRQPAPGERGAAGAYSGGARAPEHQHDVDLRAHQHDEATGGYRALPGRTRVMIAAISASIAHWLRQRLGGRGG